ncbi:TULIP family P47-like protein [Granulicella sp. dw_53]|uniref:TULIP family P47-like protein n=1 Tax=Granulicella sp. dw_53 TaxID=2719792 RepID=UPI001BD1ED3C|nr:TULIP family P47-like protein [Granulicella sp. dw_53]
MQTFGWDTVFLISNRRVNQALATNLQSLLPTFEVDLGSDPTIHAAGSFLSWEIVEGGDGKLLFFKLTIKKGTMEIGTINLPEHVKSLVPDLETFANASETVIDGVAIVLSLFLRIMPKPDASLQELAFFLEHVAYASQDSHRPGFVTVVNVIDPSGKLSVSHKTLLGASIAEYVVRNAQKIAFAFASINLVPPGTNSWLTPVESDYTYMEKIGSSDGYMAILSVTTRRPIENLSRTIDQNAINSSYTGSFLISNTMFLRNVILPALPTAYGTQPSVFTLDEDKGLIRNTRTFETKSVKSGAITYYPVISSLSVSTNGEGLETSISGSCDLKGGISMTFGIKARNRSRFDASSKTITFLSDPNPESWHSADIPWYYWFLGPIAVLITELVVKLIADSIASQLDSLAREALSITKNPPQSVHWTGTQILDVKVAGVNGAFFMMGQC